MKKDWSLLWPMVAIVTILQMALAWFGYSSGLFGGDLAPRELRQPLTLAWFVGIGALIVAVVHQDPLPGVDQDWLIRPLARTDLFLAKLLLVILVVCAPMLALDSARVLAAGFSLPVALPALLYKEVYFLLCFVVPVMGLAALTATMAELMLLGAALIAIYATALSVDAWLLGSEHCPTCDTGVSWIQHLVQHAGILIGAGVILALQYYRRHTPASRAVAVIGTLALVFGQLPWSVAFGIQGLLSPARNATQTLSVLYDDRPSSTTRQPGVAASGVPSDLALAPRNKLGGAMGYLERHSRRRATAAAMLLPVRIDGLLPDQLLLVDRSDVSLVGEGGVALYRGSNPGVLDPPSPVRSAAGEGGPSLLQAIELPLRVDRDLREHELRLRLDYSLTLMKVMAQHVIAAANGELRTDDLGGCATRSVQGDSLIQFRCQKIGRTPFCLSVTVRNAADQENPEILQCDPDYRPYLPASTEPLSRFGVDIPVRDPTGLTHYPLEATQTTALHLLIKVYAVQEHVVRSLLTPTTRLMDYEHGGAR